MSMADATFYVTGGTLRAGAPSYVERRADRELLESLRRGEFCYVLTARQMGKSSLMVRAAAELRREAAVEVLDLTALGQNLTPEQGYGGLLGRLARQLDPDGDLEASLDRYWQEHERVAPLQPWRGAATSKPLAPHSGSCSDWTRGTIRPEPNSRSGLPKRITWRYASLPRRALARPTLAFPDLGRHGRGARDCSRGGPRPAAS